MAGSGPGAQALTGGVRRSRTFPAESLSRLHTLALSIGVRDRFGEITAHLSLVPSRGIEPRLTN
jgi:hypothetical protein